MRFQCPYCRNVVAVENSDLGLDVQCGHCSEVVTVPKSRISPGCLIADFIVQEELGRGGMGVVYLSHQISLDRLSALKVLADQYANDAEFVVGFIKEARAAAKLNHPHIVQAYAVGEDEGVFYFAMENVEGETMKEVQRREKIISVDKAVMVIQQIAEALDYAWKEAKLVHRDIKPDNIMMTKKGAAKLADLGLARIAGDTDDSESDEVMGTPQYISPEHLTGAPMDVRSDIYSLGATFFHMITGRFAFEGKSAAEIAKKHLQEQAQPAIEVNPDIPQEVSDIIMKMMEKNPKKRYQDAETLVDDLRIARRGKGQTSVASASKSKEAGISTSTSMTATGTRTKIKTTHTKKTETISATGTHSTLLKEKDEQDAVRSKKILRVCVIFVLCAIIGAAIVFMGPVDVKKENKRGSSAKTGTTQSTVEATVEEPQLLTDMSALLKLRESDESAFIKGCQTFFSETASPTDPKEAIAYNELNAFFVIADENDKLAKKREAIRKAHIDKIELAEKAEKEKAEKEKAELEKARQQAIADEIAEQKEKLISKFSELKEAFDAKQSEALAELKERSTSKKWQQLDKVITLAKAHDYDKALEGIEKRKSSLEERYNDLKTIQQAELERHIKTLSFWIETVKNDDTKQALTKIKNEHGEDDKAKKALDAALEESKLIFEQTRTIITGAQSLWSILYDSGTSLEGVQLEINNSIAHVSSIKDDSIILQFSSENKVRETFSELPSKQFYRLVTKAANIAELESSVIFSYYLCNATHSAMSLEAEDELKVLGYKLLIVHYTNLSKISTSKSLLEKKIKYLETKFKADFSDEAEAFDFGTESSGDDSGSDSPSS